MTFPNPEAPAGSVFMFVFWFLQTHQEKMYQDYVANKAKEKTTQLEQYYNQVLSKLQVELNCIHFLELGLFVGCVHNWYNLQVVVLDWEVGWGEGWTEP